MGFHTGMGVASHLDEVIRYATTPEEARKGDALITESILVHFDTQRVCKFDR